MDYNFLLYRFEDLPIHLWYKISQLRQQIFVVEQKCNYLDLDGKDIDAQHLVIMLGDELVGACRILPPLEFKHYHRPLPSIGRVVISAAFRQSGLGNQLMNKALIYTRQSYVDLPIYLSAQYHLISFYEKLGFQPKGSIYLEDHIEHIAMMTKI